MSVITIVSYDSNMILHPKGMEVVWNVVHNNYSGPSTIFRDIAFINTTHGWLVGKNSTSHSNGGIILHTCDGGNSWSLQLYDESEWFKQIEVVDNKIIWVPGHGQLFHTNDGGLTWNKSIFGDRNYAVTTVKFLNHTHGWAAFRGDLYRTQDGGQTWRNDTAWNFTDDLPRRFYFTSQMKGWAIGFFGIYHTVDGGQTWEQCYNKGGWSFSFVSDIEAWAVADSMLVHMIDGLTWIEQQLPRNSILPSPNPPYYSDIVFLDKNNGWIVGSETPVVYTPNGGQDWYAQDVDIKYVPRVMALSLMNVTHGWAVGSDGLIIRTSHANYTGSRLWNGISGLVFVLIVGFSSITSIVLISVVIMIKLRRKRHVSSAPEPQ